VIATAACPRCLWERTAAGGGAPIAIAIALRAHYEVWHPAFDPPAPSIVPMCRPASRATSSAGARPRRDRRRLIPLANGRRAG
jgi:hypothetical protein